VRYRIIGYFPLLNYVYVSSIEHSVVSLYIELFGGRDAALNLGDCESTKIYFLDDLVI
jgi:hypothetical protein